MPRSRVYLYLAALGVCALAPEVRAQAFTYGLAGGNQAWPSNLRDTIVGSMDAAAATYNRHGYFDKHVTANYNPGVPTAQANYDGWIDFGSQYNTRVALHEISHTLGIGTYWAFDGGQWDENSAAGRLIKLFEGQGARLSTGGTHFWPYGLNYDNEDGVAARERHCKLVSAFRFDMGIVQDSDGDGLPDDWELFHFADLSQDGDGDPDGDGITNEHEYATDCDPGHPAPVANGRTYVVRSQISERTLSVIDASEAEGAGTEQRTPDGTLWQRWTAHYLGDGYFSFTNENSGLVLEVPSNDTTSGLPVRQAQWTGALKQQWRITGGPGAEAGYYQIANRETARVVDGLDGAEGAEVQQWPFIGDLPQQFWRFDDVTADVEPGDAGVPSGADGGALADGGFGSIGGGANTGGTSFGGAGNAGTGAFGGDTSSGGASTGFGPPAGSGAAGFAGGSAADSASGSSNGCSCRLATHRENPGLVVLAGLVISGLRRRRRRMGSRPEPPY